MEKFQIAKYGLMQVVAIVYGVLFAGTTVKLSRGMEEQGLPMPSAYYHAMFFRDYGFCLFGVVLVWTALVSYLSSPLSNWELDSDQLATTGLILAIILALVGSFFAFGGLAPMMHVFQE